MQPQATLSRSDARSAAAAIANAIGETVLGKAPQIRLAVACLLARGHLLIEDVPGVGKTTLAHSLASACGLAWRRVQFTSDMLPADLIGASVWESAHSRFNFLPGPIFAELLLADEINRAPPKTQSALLEAMEERRVSADGHTHALPDPFFVIATQNPVFHSGTFELPESQLDRFLMRLSLGYPPAEAEVVLLQGGARNQLARRQSTDREALRALQAACSAVHISTPLARYVQRLLHATRHAPQVQLGLSPRAGLAMLAAARGMALQEGRDFVAPEDVQQVWAAVAGHRLRNREGQELSENSLETLLRSVPLE